MKSPPLASATLFLLLGLAFMLVEIPLIQKMVLVLGHPIYALSVVLTTLLVSSGIGAALSGRILKQDAAWPGRMAIALLVLAVFLTGLFALANLLSHDLLRLSTGLRFGLCLVFCSIAGFLMGMPFPTLIRAIESNGDAQSIPWLWAINGAAGVLGSVVAFVVALLFGFTVTVTLGAVCYLLVVPCAFKIASSRSDDAISPPLESGVP